MLTTAEAVVLGWVILLILVWLLVTVSRRRSGRG
jgi:hypothetical protein